MPRLARGNRAAVVLEAAAAPPFTRLPKHDALLTCTLTMWYFTTLHAMTCKSSQFQAAAHQ